MDPQVSDMPQRLLMLSDKHIHQLQQRTERTSSKQRRQLCVRTTVTANIKALFSMINHGYQLLKNMNQSEMQTLLYTTVGHSQHWLSSSNGCFPGLPRVATIPLEVSSLGKTLHICWKYKFCRPDAFPKVKLTVLKH